jgi:predicted GNAT superfamily acetyltransferase
MNNFVFSQDPLLYASLTNRQNPQAEFDMRRQLDEAMAQYQALSQQSPPAQQKVQQKDYLGEIDDIVRGLDSDTILMLNADVEYIKINDDLQKMMQEEMMRSVKWKINSNPEAVTKMERMKELIQNVKKAKDEENRKVMADINEYITQYSDLTFDEYKQLKYGK